MTTYKIRTAVNTTVLTTQLEQVDRQGWSVLSVLHDGTRFVIVTYRQESA
jgi:hypothetical protein